MIIPEILWNDPEYNGCQWRHSGDPDDYSTLEWFDSNKAKPTQAQLQAKWPAISSQLAMKKLRAKRDLLISKTDWWVLPDRTPTPEQLAYRTALRNITETATPQIDSYGQLIGVTWPVNPMGEEANPNN